LHRGDWVLCDRFTGSTAAYQGYGRGWPLTLLDTLETLTTSGLQADLTLWLDVPLNESCRRRGGQMADRIEGDPCETTYADRSGKYQGQPERVVGARV